MYQSIENFTNYTPTYSPIPLSIENHLEQGSGRINEDVLLMEGNTYGVFDGATSLGNCQMENGITGGLLAARIAAEQFQVSDDLLTCMARANDRIREEILLRRNGVERHLLWSTSGAVVRLNGKTFSYCQTGDCLILLIHRDGSHKLLTPTTNHDRETLLLWKQANAPLGTNIHTFLADQIRKVRLQMNSTYGVLNGEPEAMKFIRHGRESLENISDIILFSDGLFLPSAAPESETDWQTFTDLYLQGGLKNIRDHVRTLEQLDPHLKLYPRFKQHDDIAAIGIHLDN